jgi:DNA segregation ATPase FtsK/SpoIIIE, S-DNA-T family
MLSVPARAGLSRKRWIPPDMPSSLDLRQRNELWGLGLLTLSLLLALSLVPVAWFGAGAADWFASGNLVGVLGRYVSEAVLGVLGVAGAALPLLAAIWGAFAFDRLGRATALRWTALLVGLIALLPAAISVYGGTPGFATPASGGLGAAAGAVLTAGLGAVGGGIVIVSLFAALCVATVGWNPLRSLLAGSHFAWSHARDAAAALPAPTMSLSRLRLARGGGADAADPDAAIGAVDDDPYDDFPDPWADLPEDPDATQLDPIPAAAPAASGGNGGGKTAAKKEKGARAEQVELLPVDSGDPSSTDLPGSDRLAAPPERDAQRGREELDKLGQVLIDKLATFKIDGEVVGMTSGPVVTQFEIAPAPGVKVSRIANLEADLALALRAPSVRIVAPIPGKGAVGVEVPNPTPEMVYFRETIESPQFRASKAQLPLALGKDIAGRPVVVDLARMPHLLIAGATGSGKSVCVNTIITSLIFRHTPGSLRFLMVDPKMVELSMYNDLPHLRHPVVTDNNDAAAVLKWAVLEMERRYELLSVNGVRNLQDFNERLHSGQLMRSPEAEGEEGDPDRWLYRGGRCRTSWSSSTSWRT